jgi:hypothetical protein
MTSTNLTFMKLGGVIGLLVLSACNESALENAATERPVQTQAELTDCVRKALKLDEGRWDYMGTIARGNGMFRTYETTSVHKSAGEDMWSHKAFGGDVGGDEASAEAGVVRLVGASVIPVEYGELNEDEAVTYTSCTGPDQEGRYETTMEYTLPHNDGSKLSVKNLTWYSEHGSYYAEDIAYQDGRVIARRSGVNTPAE